LGSGDYRFRRPLSEGLAADFAFDQVRIVVGPADGTEDEVEDVLLFHGSFFGVGLEFRGTPRALRIASGDEAPAIRADEQDPDLPLLEDPIRISIAQLLRMAEARLEQLQRALAVEAEGSAEPYDRLVNHEGPAVPALRLVRRDGLLADGTKDPGLFPGHRRWVRALGQPIKSPFRLSLPIPYRTLA